jgi:hypothetical protein
MVVFLSVIIGLLGFYFANRVQSVLVLQFWIMLLMLNNMLSKYNEFELKKLGLGVSYILFSSQLIVLLNNINGDYTAILPDLLYVYNYEQYFSYGMILGLYLITIFCKSKFIHCHDVNTAFMGLLASKITGKILISDLHEWKSETSNIDAKKQNLFQICFKQLINK